MADLKKCDRCGEVVERKVIANITGYREDRSSWSDLTVSFKNDELADIYKELCADCSLKLRDFLKISTIKASVRTIYVADQPVDTLMVDPQNDPI